MPEEMRESLWALSLLGRGIKESIKTASLNCHLEKSLGSPRQNQESQEKQRSMGPCSIDTNSK